MAGRSDFLNATIPRSIKKILILDGSISSREQRLFWLDAHKSHKRFKMRQNSSPAGRLPEARDLPDTE